MCKTAPVKGRNEAALDNRILVGNFLDNENNEMWDGSTLTKYIK